MHSPPLVSIGLPVYNDESSIRRTIESFIAQDYQNLEIIISDDCSSDYTGSICAEIAKLDSRIKYIRQKRNIGSLANHRIVFDLSNGNYFMWCNGHDYVSDNYVSSCLHSLECDRSIVLCGGKTQRFAADGTLKELRYSGLNTSELNIIHRFTSVYLASINDAMLFYGIYRASVLRQTGFHRKTLGGDLILLAEMALHGNLLQKEDTVFYRRVREFTSLQAQQYQVGYIVQPKGFCFEAIAPSLDMAYEYLQMIISNTSKNISEQEALLGVAIELLNQNFGFGIRADIEKLFKLKYDEFSGKHLRNIFLNELIRYLNKAKFFCDSPCECDHYIYKCIGDINSMESVTAIEGKSLNWDDIRSMPTIKLYVGDIPADDFYNDVIGLSITQSNERHIVHDITQPLPILGASVDSFQAEDVFEHIPIEKIIPVVNEVFRVLKPNGIFRLSVPDYGCDVLRNRCKLNASDRVVFDPGGGAFSEDMRPLWFPRIDVMYYLLEQTQFFTNGSITFLHYWNMDNLTYITKPIDYSKGLIRRTPDFDERVNNPYRPMSLVVDLVKN